MVNNREIKADTTYRHQDFGRIPRLLRRKGSDGRFEIFDFNRFEEVECSGVNVGVRADRAPYTGDVVATAPTVRYRPVYVSSN
jgi:hypothetical protein